MLKKLKKKEAEQINIKIAIEERKLLMTQRKLESIRLLDELFERVKQEKLKKEERDKESGLEDNFRKKKEEKHKKKHEKDKKKKERLPDQEKELRNKVVKKIKSTQEQRIEERREKLKKAIEGKNKLKTSLKLKDGSECDEFELFRGSEFDMFPDFATYEAFRSEYLSSFSSFFLTIIRYTKDYKY